MMGLTIEQLEQDRVGNKLYIYIYINRGSLKGGALKTSAAHDI